MLNYNSTALGIADPYYRDRRLLMKLEDKLNTRHEYLLKQSNYKPYYKTRYLRELHKVKQDVERLDEYHVNSHTVKTINNIGLEKYLQNVFPGTQKPGKAKLSKWENHVLKMLHEKTREARKQEYAYRLNTEIEYRTSIGWYLIFNTLTVNGEHYNNVFSKDAKAFKTYIRNFDTIAAQAAYGSVRNAKGKEYHTYFAVVEEGAKKGRLHIHCLHCIKSMDFTDPNLGSSKPLKREITKLKQLWPYGWSVPIACRYANDPFTQDNWQWPIDKKDGKPIKIKHPGAMAGYISKYVNKTYDAPKRTNYLWRCRMSRNFGKQIINKLIHNLNRQELQFLVTNQPIKLQHNSRTIPKTLLNISAMKKLLLLSNHNEKTIIRNSSIPQENLLQRLRNLMQTKQMFSYQNIGIIDAQTSLSTGVFNELQSSIIRKLEEVYRDIQPTRQPVARGVSRIPKG
jgi:hypothetical protein